MGHKHDANIIQIFGIGEVIGCFSSISDSMNSTVTTEQNAGYIVGVVGFILSSVTMMTTAIVVIVVTIAFTTLGTVVDALQG